MNDDGDQNRPHWWAPLVATGVFFAAMWLVTALGG
jgi:hypothetical protein